MSTGVCIARHSRGARLIFCFAAIVFAGGLGLGVLLALASAAAGNLVVAMSHRPGAIDDLRRLAGNSNVVRPKPAHVEDATSTVAGQAMFDDAFRTAETAEHGGDQLKERLTTASLADGASGAAWRLKPALPAQEVEPARSALSETPRVVSPIEPVQLASLTPPAQPAQDATPEQAPTLRPAVDADRALPPAVPAVAATQPFVPIPRPRPADSARMAQGTARAADGPVYATAARPARGTALAYAAPEADPRTQGAGDFFRNLLDKSQGLQLPPRSKGIAIYDIASATVRLPNGERLEAHSGLGHRYDNPAYVREKNRGPTPPNVYDLRMREALFHGAEAIRLLPRDQKKVFNRDGLLAHHYMYAGGGPRSQSNGCVVFKDYGRFLRAFKTGEIARLVVVPNMAELPSYMAGL